MKAENTDLVLPVCYGCVLLLRKMIDGDPFGGIHWLCLGLNWVCFGLRPFVVLSS